MPRILTRHVVTLTTLAAFRATTALHRATRVQTVSMSSMDGVVPWRERITGSIARSRKIRGGNYVQLATVDADNAPHCRTVVFRGFAPDGRLKIITDKRSAKVKESRRVEVCWWFSQSSEQYRFAGDITYVDGDGSADDVALRKQQWGNLSDKAREQFFWAHPPAHPFDAAPEAVPAGGRDAEGKVLPAPDVFLLGLVAPDAVDYLRLTDNFRQLDRLADGAWDCARVNP